MLGPLRRRLSYANVVASLALFIALGGTGYAALTVTGRNVKDASLTGRDVKNSSLTTSDVKNGSLLGQDFKAGQLPAGAPGAPGAPGVTGLKGDKGEPGAPGTARAYAFVSSSGAVDETKSKGITDANVTAAGNTYCFGGLGFTPSNVMVTSLESYRDAMVEMGAGLTCQFRVVLSGANGFMILIN